MPFSEASFVFGGPFALSNEIDLPIKKKGPLYRFEFCIIKSVFYNCS